MIFNEAAVGDTREYRAYASIDFLDF